MELPSPHGIAYSVDYRQAENGRLPLQFHLRVPRGQGDKTRGGVAARSPAKSRQNDVAIHSSDLQFWDERRSWCDLLFETAPRPGRSCGGENKNCSATCGRRALHWLLWQRIKKPGRRTCCPKVGPSGVRVYTLDVIGPFHV